MRRFIIIILSGVLIFALHPCLAQESNRPQVWSSGKEPLGERDNNFSTGRRHKLFSKRHKQGFDHKKKPQSAPAATRKKRGSFDKKRYTGKKGFLGIFGNKSKGWGGKSFKSNGKEDKRLFKAPKNKARDKKRRLLKRR